ncbi:M18 family aminopeptidase [Sansalvadorimonas sp. 2012CJ34-2]|uniref:M18 family aminopeptidase n=1 Tax=Parendozoicomonas callyspongiae TaxID=2942213 RepID=A0ABT0PFP9_9GAMM|nr:M18 family aminopeptidase [Sansalvadorimonas sp. 2012CJ34-2]MCL6270200.1 M18 family aminopeptidase [Sansalvadorimonas sp. 2012CJ34-2]
MNTPGFNQDLIAFLQDSPTAYHATAEMARRFSEAGFISLNERDSWSLEAGKKYFVIRQDSAIVAFTTGNGRFAEQGIRMVGAHTDSPALKVKPNPEVNSKGYFQLGVEVYGGPLLNPWFDRDLSLAGKVTWLNADGQMQNSLVNFKRPIAIIPSLAIHLDREANKKRSINPQKDIPPVLSQIKKGDDTPDFRQILSKELEKNGDKAETILDYELFFYDTQPPAMVGLNEEFIASARLDNLLSCYTGMQALIEAKDTDQPCLLICNDHEEVGSASPTGACGPFLRQVLERIFDTHDEFVRAMQNSMMISTDNAHGIHPNFADRHDGNHGPLLNEGAVLKINANLRYATTSETSSLFRQMCKQEDVPVQVFVARTDMGCGSTIGPLTATELGVRTLDIGLPTFSMHSIRELAGSEDAAGLAKVLTRFFHLEKLLP